MTMRAELVPRLLELLAGTSESDDPITRKGSFLARPAIAFLRPHFDRRVDRWLERPPHELDEEFAGIVAWLGQFRSDGAAALVVTGAGTVAVPLEQLPALHAWLEDEGS